MPESITSGPFIGVYLFLLGVVFCRAQATYWLGRYVRYLGQNRKVPDHGWRRRIYDWSHRDTTRGGIESVRRRGWIIIPFSFLTVGFQSVANFGAGLLFMPWRVYTAAMIPGCLAWALIYSTVGFSVWNAAVAAAAGSPLGIAIIVALVVAVIAWIVWRKKVTSKAERRVAVPPGSSSERPGEAER